MRKVIDIGGKRFGSLTALAHSSSDKGHAIWTCLCDCGRYKEQNNNRRNNILVTDGKRVFTLAQMVELLNLDYGKTYKSFRKGVFPDGFRIFQP